MKMKIYIRGDVTIDVPDSVCIDVRKNGTWRLTHSEDETRAINSAIRKKLREAAFEEERSIRNVTDLSYHSMFAGREYPRMQKDVL